MKTETNCSFFLTMLFVGLIVGLASECMAQAQTGSFIQQDFNGIVRFRASNLDSTKQAGFYATLPTDTFKIRFTKDSAFVESTTPVVLKASLIYPQGAVNGYVLKTNASGLASWQPAAFSSTEINDTVINSTTGGVLFTNANGLLRQNAQRFYWDSINNSLSIGSNTPTARLTVKGDHINSSSFALAVHDSTGTSNALIVRNDGNVGIGTSNPQTRLQIGGVHNFSTSVTGGQTTFGTRLDQNSNTIWSLENRTNGANSEALIFIRSFDEGTTLSQTSPTYTNNYNGSEGRAGVLYTKIQNSNAGKQKFAISNTSNAYINKFEWISAVAINGILTNGFGTTPPIMTLVGNGNLLLGTINDVSSSILTINSNTKGVLLPRLTTTQINAITSPATGLTVYNITENTLCFFNGTNWQKVTSTNL